MSVNELSKKEQRKEAKQKIAILTLEEKANKSRKVFLSILDCGLIKNDKLLFCYISTADEVSTEAKKMILKLQCHVFMAIKCMQ